jgi:hypothetical protein
MKILLLALSVTLFVGCSVDDAYRYYGSQKYPARPAKSVAILNEAPSQPYEVIADFQYRGASPNRMKTLAGNIGADAVIVTTLGGYYKRSDVWADKDSMADSFSRVVGTAIKYKP